MKPRVYVETSVVSYLTSRPSRDVVVLGHQETTREWWERCRPSFDLFTSQPVLDEAAAGDPDAARARLDALNGLPILAVTDQATKLSRAFVERGPLPPKAAVDALHLALAVVHRVDYLLTWNCVHLANASLRGAIDRVCRGRGYETVVICTPDELLSEQ